MSELTPELLSAFARSRALAAFGAIALWSCAPELPVGRFACHTDGDCPGGWACAENANGALRCYPDGTDWNAIHGKDGSVPSPAIEGGESLDSGAGDKDATPGTVGNPPRTKPKPAAGSGGASAGTAAAGMGGASAGSAAAGHGGTTSPPDAGGPPPNPTCTPESPGADRGVFVSPTGSSADDCGTAGNPCSTILQGMDRAQALSRSLIFVDDGKYAESVTLRAGLTIRGGFDRSGDKWTRSCAVDRATHARIESPTEVGVLAEYSGSAELDSITVSTLAKAPMGHSMYGVFARGTSTQLTLRDVEVYAASGGDGQTGNSGATPAPRTGTCAPSSDGADGATDGLPGSGAATGTIDSSGYVPGDGLPGEPGLPGDNGTAGLSTCRACLESCDTSTCTGTAAGESCGVGGGSGCGGAPAAGGGGGGGGGSSFGIFVWGARVKVIGGLLQTGNGGRGGAGGNAGNGGVGSDGSAGSNGESCTVCVKGSTTGPVIPPQPTPDGTAVEASRIEAAGNVAVVPISDGGVVPISCSAGKASGVGTAGGRGGAGSRSGLGGGGAGGNSYGAWAGGQGQLDVSSSTRIQIGDAGRSQTTGAIGESTPMKQL